MILKLQLTDMSIKINTDGRCVHMRYRGYSLVVDLMSGIPMVGEISRRGNEFIAQITCTRIADLIFRAINIINNEANRESVRVHERPQAGYRRSGVVI